MKTIPAAVVALIVCAVGCSKPITEMKESGGSGVVAPVPAATAIAIPRTKAEIVAELLRVGVVLEPFEFGAPKAGTTSYRTKKTSVGVAFTERGGDLISVEAMTLSDKSGNYERIISDFASSVTEIITSQHRETCRDAIANALSILGSQPGKTIHRMPTEKGGYTKIEITRHGDSGYSFVFSVDPKSTP